MFKLNIGCGTDIKPLSDGWVNIDLRALDGVNLVIDLEKYSLPYESESVDFVNMQDFLEHLPALSQMSFLANVFHILKHGGKVYVQIPHLRVLSERYLNILQDPTSIQHPLTAEQFAQLLYGGQDYEGNFHKWAYDEQSLRKALVDCGLSALSIRSDGGSNLLCDAIKPPEWVYVSASGGLGDVIQTYLSSPSDPEGSSFVNGYASSDPSMSLWFRRLNDLKRQFPNQKVRLVVSSHNKYSDDLFKFHPCIDEIVEMEWQLHDFGNRLDAEYGKMACIHRNYNYKYFKATDPVIYLSDEENDVLSKITNNMQYILVHPFAGCKERSVPSLGKYLQMSELLYKHGYHSIYVGAGNNLDIDQVGILNLINKASCRLTTALAINASGFIGVHSAMILASWYGNKRSICFAPPYHDTGVSWQEFFGSKNPTTCHADKDFNKTVIVENDLVDIEKEVEWICR